jgi:DNA invertase Pin-like site-specific DNA recombinase
MSIYGYVRVSTFDQDFSIQHAALKMAGCAVIRAETASGTGGDGRTKLPALLDFLRAGWAAIWNGSISANSRLSAQSP